MTHNFDAAIAELPTGDDFNNHVGHESSDYLYVYSDTIQFALKFTKAALSGEVIDSVIEAGTNEAGFVGVEWKTIDTFNAMCAELAKEVGNG